MIEHSLVSNLDLFQIYFYICLSHVTDTGIISLDLEFAIQNKLRNTIYLVYVICLIWKHENKIIKKIIYQMRKMLDHICDNHAWPYI